MSEQITADSIARAQELLAAGVSYRATARAVGIPRKALARLLPDAAHRASAEERFWSKVDVSGDCWEWTACRSRDGYGRFQLHGRMPLAHRVAFELLRGPIPEGLELDHLCRNRACVRPDHLEPVTHAENMRRSKSHNARCAAKTHCPKGHPYSGDNLYVTPRGSRDCRACRREASRRAGAARKTGAGR